MEDTQSGPHYAGLRAAISAVNATLAMSGAQSSLNDKGITEVSVGHFELCSTTCWMLSAALFAISKQENRPGVAAVFDQYARTYEKMAIVETEYFARKEKGEE